MESLDSLAVTLRRQLQDLKAAVKAAGYRIDVMYSPAERRDLPTLIIDKTPATLATAKHGGCVQLGKNDLSTSEGGRAFIRNFFAQHLRRNDFTQYITTRLAADFACALAQYLCVRIPEVPTDVRDAGWQAFCAAPTYRDMGRSKVDAAVEAALTVWVGGPAKDLPALDAQPSPGDQGDARAQFETWATSRGWSIKRQPGGLQRYCSCDTERMWEAFQAALAARQPVGEPLAYTSETQLKALRVCGDGIMSQRNAKWSIPLYTAPPAQAVDLGAEPMFYIQDTRQFVGNCPMWWGPNGRGYVTRLDEAGRYTEQEAIKQNRTRDTDIPWPCAEIDAIARQTVDLQHMRPRAERLAELALIGSQAVGNG